MTEEELRKTIGDYIVKCVNDKLDEVMRRSVIYEVKAAIKGEDKKVIYSGDDLWRALDRASDWMCKQYGYDWYIDGGQWCPKGSQGGDYVPLYIDTNILTVKEMFAK